jgi:ATP-binding cassette subfamily B protein
VAFHEDYTSGRVISRQTSDIDSISDLFEEGLDSLIAAILTPAPGRHRHAAARLEAGPGGAGRLRPADLADGLVPARVARAYRRTRETIALVIVHFVETFGGIRAVQAFRREQRNSEIFSGWAEDYSQASAHASRLIAIYGPASRWSATSSPA